MIQIICDEDENPQKVGYSWHYEMKKSGWDSGDLRKDGNNPKVYVEKGGHASNFEPGTLESENDYTTLTDDDYSIKMLSNQDWLNFRGRWGSSGSPGPSPEGPVFRHSKHGTAPAYWGELAHMWLEPLYWHDATHNKGS